MEINIQSASSPTAEASALRADKCEFESHLAHQLNYG